MTDSPYTYTGTETPIETPEMTTEERLKDAETALEIIFGEAERGPIQKELERYVAILKKRL